MKITPLISSLAISLLAGGSLALQRMKFSSCPGAACLFPVAGAEFLTGAQFDIRVEIHADGAKYEPADDFSITVSKLGRDGKEGAAINLEEFFVPKVVNPALERWNFTYAKDGIAYYKDLEGDSSAMTPVNVASRIWRNVSFKEAGTYVATIKYDNGKTEKVDWIVRAASCKRLARNAIFFIADGTTISMISAARVMARKQKNGKFPNKLVLDSAPEIGHILTHSLDSMMTDSANSASAYHTGHKTTVNALGVYPDSSPDHFDDPKQELLAELARRRSDARGGKMAIGIVTTAEVQDATPAAVFSHTRRRDDKPQIVDQLLYGAVNATTPVIADVFLGGGGAYFHNKTGGKSWKGRDYYNKYAKEFGYKVINTGKELRSYSGSDPLLGIFHKGHMNVFVDRQMYPDNLKGNKASPVGDNKDSLDQPTLVDMTKVTLDILKKRGGDAGFFAMIEAASPDKQMHTMDYHRSLTDIVEFDNAIKAAIEWVKKNDPSTLIVITADHGHGFDVYGTVDTEIINSAPESKNNIKRRQAIATSENAGWPDYVDNDNDGYPDNLNVKTVFAAATNNHPNVYENWQMNKTAPRKPAELDPHTTSKVKSYIANKNFNQQGNIHFNGNLPAEEDEAVHTITDVGVFAFGPGAQLFGKVMDSTEVFFNFAKVLALGEIDPSKCEKCSRKKQNVY